MTGLVADLLRRHFAAPGGRLHLGGQDIERLVGRHGTPLFVYDAQVLDRQWDHLRETFPPQVVIAYSVKANPNPHLARRFVARGACLEIASAGEYALALSAGARPGDILFAGPGKTDAELEAVLKQGIGEIHAESEAEVRRIAALAGRSGIRARIALRVNPAAEAEGGAMRMGGRSLPFGVDEEQLEGVLMTALALPELDVRGLHVFAGTQILDHAVLVRQYRVALALGARVASVLGRPLATLDLGGGLGIPYFPNEAPLDTERLREELTGLFGDACGRPEFAGTRFVVEPGRYLVGEAGIYVSRVVDVKESRGKRFAVLDGGMNHHLAASGNLGQVIRRNFPVAVLNRLDESPVHTIDLVGPLCTPLDVLARDVALPAVRAGDLVGVFQSGAYARTASPLHFLSHVTPMEVLVDRGADQVIRHRGSHDDLFRDLPPCPPIGR